MPFDVDVDAVRGVIRISLSGAIADPDLMELSRRVRSDSALSAGMPVLYDCSEVTDVRVSGELVHAMAVAARGDRNRVAFVTPSAAAFGLARMYQIVSDAAAERIHVFTHQEAAEDWLKAE